MANYEKKKLVQINLDTYKMLQTIKEVENRVYNKEEGRRPFTNSFILETAMENMYEEAKKNYGDLVDAVWEEMYGGERYIN